MGCRVSNEIKNRAVHEINKHQVPVRLPPARLPGTAGRIHFQPIHPILHNHFVWHAHVASAAWAWTLDELEMILAPDQVAQNLMLTILAPRQPLRNISTTDLAISR